MGKGDCKEQLDIIMKTGGPESSKNKCKKCRHALLGNFKINVYVNTFMGFTPPATGGGFFTFSSQFPGTVDTGGGLNSFFIQFLSFSMPLVAI